MLSVNPFFPRDQQHSDNNMRKSVFTKSKYDQQHLDNKSKSEKISFFLD